MEADGQSLEQMVAVMEQQVKVLDDLAAVCRKKSEILVGGDLQTLDLMLRGEQALLWQMGKLEEQRFGLQVEIAHRAGIHPSSLTLDRLMVIVPGPYTVRYQEIAEQYEEAVASLNQLNHLNGELVQQAMAFIEFSLQLTGAGKAGGARIYSTRGVPDQAAQGKLRRLDNRI